MRTVAIAVVCALALSLSGCLVVPVALHPFYTAKTTVAEPALVGQWVADDDKTMWTFESLDDSTYRVKFTDPDFSGTLQARVVRLGKTSFLDVTPDMSEEKNASLVFAVPGHWPLRLYVKGDLLKLTSIDTDWLESSLKNKQLKLRYEVLEDDDMVITASTAELQKMLVKYGDNPKVFSELKIFKRKR